MGSGPSKQLDTLHVVIIGAGYGGVKAAADLKKAGVRFTIIDPKEYFHHCFASLRAAVKPEEGVKVAIPLREAFGASFVQGMVHSLHMESKKVVLACGKEIEFTHCIIAVGSLGPAPARSEKVLISELLKDYEDVGKAIADAEKIVIVGGGAVGVEFAGEICDQYKGKDVTIVSSSEKLVCQDFDQKFYSNLQYYIDAAGVKVMPGRVSNLSELVPNVLSKQEVMVGNTRLEAELVLVCAGLPPNKASVARIVAPHHRDSSGRIQVNQYFALEGQPAVFAIGDCCNTPGHKLGVYAMKQAEMVVGNIIKEASGSGCPPTQWSLPFVGMLIPFGSSTGSAIANGWIIPNCVATFIKYGDLATAKTWGMLGLEVPKS